MSQLARRWPSSTGDRVYNTWLVAALTQAVKPDIGSELRFLPTLPAFDSVVLTGTPLTGASNAGGVGRNRDSEPISAGLTACVNTATSQVL